MTTYYGPLGTHLNWDDSRPPTFMNALRLFGAVAASYMRRALSVCAGR